MARLASSLVVGDRIWEEGSRESDEWSPGRIVAIVDCEERKNFMFMLVRDDDGLYTFYACLKDCICRPWLARRWPEEVGRILLETGLGRELEPEPERPRKVKPRPVVHRQPVSYSEPEPEPEPEPVRLLPEIDCPRLPLPRSV
jgi:hypothetical protein